jgi:hypothetical protein
MSFTRAIRENTQKIFQKTQKTQPKLIDWEKIN